MIKIGDRQVGSGAPCFVIAEAGSNHNGCIEQARALIDAAAQAGCDAIKFQCFLADQLVQRTHPAHEALKGFEFPREWIAPLTEYCRERHIIFSATPFDSDAVDQLVGNGMPFLKWASPEIHDIGLIEYALGSNLPFIMSTGMATVANIQHALQTLGDRADVILLHCTSLYPTDVKDLNLRMMVGMAQTFGKPVGLSDHTQSVAIPAVAVALGACVIEKHFTLDRQMDGPDHGYAIEPPQLTEMVQHIRDTEAALGEQVKQPVPAEDPTINYKSLVAIEAIPKGTVLRKEMLVAKRTREGVLPIHMDSFIGQTTDADIDADELVTWDKI